MLHELTKKKTADPEFLSVMTSKSRGERSASSSKLLVIGNLEAVK